MVQDGEINRLDAILCLAIYICFTAYLVGLVRDQVTAAESMELKVEVAELTLDSRKAARFGLACVRNGRSDVTSREALQLTVMAHRN